MLCVLLLALGQSFKEVLRAGYTFYLDYHACQRENGFDTLYCAACVMVRLVRSVGVHMSAGGIAIDLDEPLAPFNIRLFKFSSF